MKQATTTTYRRTREAAKRKAKSERTNREATWDLILAGAADGDDAGLPISGMENVLRIAEVCAEELVTDTGEPLATSTVRNMMALGRWAHEEATSAEIEVLRTLGWTTAMEVSRRGATPSAVADAVGRGIKTKSALIDEFSVSGDTDDAEDGPVVTDSEVEKAAHLILLARSERASGRYTPGPVATLLLTLVRPEVDWDEELRTLVSN